MASSNDAAGTGPAGTDVAGTDAVGTDAAGADVAGTDVTGRPGMQVRDGAAHGAAGGGLAGPRGAAQGQGRRSVVAWCLYDWAASAFNTVVGTFVFSVYFARGIYGEETAGSAAWGFAMGLAGLAIAVLSPVLGAIADGTGRRKPWLGLLTLATVTATALLWFARPEPGFVGYALVMAALATVTFELAGVFYNALLPEVAPPAMVGRVSGWGWGLGYAGGLVCLALALFGLIRPAPPPFGLDPAEAENIRATVLLVALWMALFSLPLLLWTRDRPPTGRRAGAAVREGLATLAGTIRQLGRHGRVLRFLIASALYRDGLATLFALGGLYAAGTFGMSLDQILMFAIGLNVTAGLGAAGFAWLDDGIGPKPTILIALAGLIVFGAALLLVTGITAFILLGLGLGLFVGPAQAASRSLMARLAPPGLAGEMFGLYQFTGRAASFLGPVAFAAATTAFDSQRAGMATILGFWLAGGALLLTVRSGGPAAAPGEPAAAGN